MLPKNNSTRNVFEGKQTRSRLQQQAVNLSSQKKGNLSQVERKKVKIIPLRKLFILDTNVILSDPNCIFKFEDNDVYIPTVVRAELDNHKKGTDDTARNSREFSRTLKSELSKHSQNIRDGIPLKEASKKLQLVDCIFRQTILKLTRVQQKQIQKFFLLPKSLLKNLKVNIKLFL